MNPTGKTKEKESSTKQKILRELYSVCDRCLKPAFQQVLIAQSNESLLSRFWRGHLSLPGSLAGPGGSVEQRMLALMEGARGHFEEGFPSLGIPPLEPLEMEDYTSHIYQRAIIKVDLFMDHITIAGLKTYVIEKFSFNISDLTMTLDFSFAKLTMNSKYKVIGKVATVIPFNPSGDAHIETFEITGKVVATLETRNGHLHIKAFTNNIDVKNTKVTLTGLGIGALKSLCNWVLTRISDKAMQEQKDSMAEATAEYIVEMANEVLMQLKLSDLIG